MRRWATWLLVGALAALGAVAAADGLRGKSSTLRAEPPLPTASSPASEPEREEPSGTLYFSSADDGCRLRALDLPSLVTAPPPKLRSCGFTLSPDGTAALPGRAAWSPRGGLYARESAGTIELGSPVSAERLTFPGRVPAFMPDGTFTSARGRAVVAWTTDCPRTTRLFTLPGDNATARCKRVVARLIDGPPRSLVWISPTRIAAVIGAAEQELVVQERSRIILRVPGWGAPIDELRVSPLGTYLAVRAEGRGGVLVFDREGDAVPLPPLRGVRALAWSPDDRWTAAATQFGVYLFPSDRPDAEVRRIPVRAVDVAWR
jgi:hypothetical protein